jgi:hypothetical protein
MIVNKTESEVLVGFRFLHLALGYREDNFILESVSFQILRLNPLFMDS